MKWRHISTYLAVSECKQYEVSGRYTDGHFAWRGRVVDTDQLVQASADRGYVERCCDRHARSVRAEDTA